MVKGQGGDYRRNEVAKWVPDDVRGVSRRFLSAFERTFFSITLGIWHSQLLGSFEAKNITCVFLHENSNLAIEITKDVFPDVKKCKKVRKSGLKRLFCIFQPYGRGEFDQFSPPMCATRRVFQPCG